MNNTIANLQKYDNKKVLITGHTGFKGSWMSLLLQRLRADVTGYSNGVPTEPALYDIANIGSGMKSVCGDIRDLNKLKEVFDEVQPEIVIHMAAQPIVGRSYEDPVETFEVNTIGTVNVLECIRFSDSVRSAVIVTTDKVYEIEQDGLALDESARLGGYDPYAASKACSELAVSSYKKSFLSDRDISVTTARAGNVIGGGDFAENRIIPDVIKASVSDNEVVIRNPKSSRPYQHVLDPVVCYLELAMRQIDEPELAGAYNIAPVGGSISNLELVDRLCNKINTLRGKQSYKQIISYSTLDTSENESMHETEQLVIDASKIQEKLGWLDRLSIDDALDEVVGFAEAFRSGGDIKEHIDSFIDKYLEALWKE